MVESRRNSSSCIHRFTGSTAVIPGRGAAGCGWRVTISLSLLVGPEGEHRAVAGVGDDQQIARLVEGQIDRLLGDVADRLRPGGSPATSGRCGSRGRRRNRACPWLSTAAPAMFRNPSASFSTLAPAARTVESDVGREGSGPPVTSSTANSGSRTSTLGGRLEDRAVERDPAVAVAVEVPEADVAGLGHLRRVRERHEATDHAVEEGVGELEVARAVDLQGQGLGAFLPLLLELHRVEPPVGGVANDHLVADVVLEGHRVHPAARGGVRDEHAGLGVGAGGPDVLEGSAAAVGDPEAGGLAVPGVAIAQPSEAAAARREPACRARRAGGRRSSWNSPRPSISRRRRGD